MKTLKVCCQGCGADLDVSEGIRFVTCNYCSARLEVVHDATVTHTRQLDNIERTTNQMAGNLKVIELQNELERMDREWDLQRESLMVRGEGGNISAPGGVAPVIGGMIAVVFGVVMMCFAFSKGAPTIIGLFFFAFIGIAIYGMFAGSAKAIRYRNADAVYRGRRARLAAIIERERKKS